MVLVLGLLLVFFLCKDSEEARNEPISVLCVENIRKNVDLHTNVFFKHIV